MPSIHLPYVNIALDAFALIVTLIVLASCVKEYSNKKIGSKYFLVFQASIVQNLGNHDHRLFSIHFAGNTESTPEEKLPADLYSIW